MEDEPLPRWTGAKMLESLGAFVVTAESCAEAEEQWHGNVLDLVVCDYRLADGMATDVVERMRLAGREEPVICLTGEAESLSEEEQQRLKLRAVLRKPMDAEILSGLFMDVRAQESPAAVAEAPAISSNASLPVWISPIWGVLRTPGFAAERLVLAPGSAGDVWVAAFGCVDVFEGEAATALRLGDLLGRLCRGLPASAPAQALISAGLAALERGLDSEHDWNLEALHLHEQGVSAAANGSASLRVWISPENGEWQPLAMTGSVQPAHRVLLGALELNHPEAVWSGLGAGGVERVGGLMKSAHEALVFWTRKPSRSLVWSEPAREGACLAASLCKMEQALALDGVSPEAARKASCGLLDLIEWGGGGRLRVQWQQAGSVDVLLEGAQPPPCEFTRFFTNVNAGVEGSVLSVAAGRTQESPAVEQRSSRRWGGPAPERLGRFVVAALPELVNEAVAGRIAEEHRKELWLALDCSRVRHLSSRALAVWCAQAIERSMGGRFCLVNYSSRLGRVFRELGLRKEMELVASHEELDSAGRRLTSLSERELLMESIVGGPEA